MTIFQSPICSSFLSSSLKTFSVRSNHKLHLFPPKNCGQLPSPATVWSLLSLACSRKHHLRYVKEIVTDKAMSLSKIVFQTIWVFHTNNLTHNAIFMFVFLKAAAVYLETIQIREIQARIKIYWWSVQHIERTSPQLKLNISPRSNYLYSECNRVCKIVLNSSVHLVISGYYTSCLSLIL